jgi:hypothetical protein
MAEGQKLVPTGFTTATEMHHRRSQIIQVRNAWLFFWSATTCASPPPRPSIFTDYSFWVHHLVNRDGRHLLAHAMASDFAMLGLKGGRGPIFPGSEASFLKLA